MQLMQYLVYQKAYQKKELWRIGLEQIRLIWLQNFGLRLRLLLLWMKENNKTLIFPPLKSSSPCTLICFHIKYMKTTVYIIISVCSDYTGKVLFSSIKASQFYVS